MTIAGRAWHQAGRHRTGAKAERSHVETTAVKGDGYLGMAWTF